MHTKVKTQPDMVQAHAAMPVQTAMQASNGINVRVEAVFVTPELALDWLTSWEYPNQRPERLSQVERLEGNLTGDRFMPGTQLKVAHVDGKSYLIDGQHRLEAIVNSGVGAIFTLTHHDCTSMVQVADLYSTTDRGVPRGAVDVLRAHGLHHESDGIAMDYLRAIGAAARFIHAGFRRARHIELTDADLVATTEHYMPAAQAFLQCMDDASVGTKMRVRLRRAPVLALALVLFDEAYNNGLADKVVEFWTKVGSGVNLQPGEPAQLAYVHLMETTLGNTGSSIRAERQIRTLAHLWNAHCKGRMYVTGRTRGSTKVWDENGPFEVVGTQFKGAK